MKITVNKKNLQRALGFVERVTAKNTALPILSNVLLKTENGRLKLIATNLEIGVSAVIGAKLEKEGQIAVPGRILTDFVRSVPAETLNLSVAQNVLTVDGGSYKTTILCFDPAEYPPIPKVGAQQDYAVSVTVLRQLLASAVDSIAGSDSRPELAGALLAFETDKLVIAATDSFRLIERSFEAPNKQIASVIVPRGTVTELLRILAEVEGEVGVRVADNQIAFSHEDFEIISRLVDGRYPDYKKIIPEKYSSKALVRKDELENAIKAAALFSSSISDIKIECHAQKVELTAKNSSKGEIQAAVQANLKGEPFEIAVNYRYFLDGLKVLNTEKIVLEFTGKGSPFVLRPNDDKKDTVYLIMPLRN